MAGGVRPLILDDKLGYTYATMDPNIKELMYFKSSGFLYMFVMIWDDFDHEEIDKVINSIKFFD